MHSIMQLRVNKKMDGVFPTWVSKEMDNGNEEL